jgi:8-oxo-dGTP pyrophosphatase MutT (NUDIX family)
MPHINKNMDYTVEVFILHKGRLLLRLHDKYKIWLGAGGHIEPDEDPNEAAYREVREETGLDIHLIAPRELAGPSSEKHKKELVPPWFINRHHVNDEHEHVAFVYFAISSSDNIVPEAIEDASDECIWVGLEELKGMELKDDIRFYAETALRLIGPQS